MIKRSLTSWKEVKNDDSVAQQVEHDTFNVGVLGSNPSGITKGNIQQVFYNG